LLTRGSRQICPDLRQVAGEDDNFAVERLANHHLRKRLGSGLPGERFLGPPNFVQRRFPPAFQFAGDETIVWIAAVELPFGQRFPKQVSAGWPTEAMGDSLPRCDSWGRRWWSGARWL